MRALEFTRAVRRPTKHFFLEKYLERVATHPFQLGEFDRRRFSDWKSTDDEHETRPLRSRNASSQRREG